ncbi:hypothetical protein [Piscinibacter gummiphilus]|uniref:Uncharacterized protein n=1 Tax=Piscinibacter gummiphilus TaxID=946333 RepID=A0ABZ0CNI0_9BURK|nr:hypothetical protein [Piscinibacter gummiphilus]WOB06556.1 hypothetical protein RXV79_16680 [Piscinibacter gummiphilus]
MTTNFERTANWLKACGKFPRIVPPADMPSAEDGTAPNEAGLSVQIGCQLEEFAEYLKTLNVMSPTGATSNATQEVAAILDAIGYNLKKGHATAVIYDREQALDALCDIEVTGNGVAYMAAMNKPAADLVVLQSNDDKLNEDGTPVILEGGKIGKRPGWTPPDLSPFV